MTRFSRKMYSKYFASAALLATAAWLPTLAHGQAAQPAAATPTPASGAAAASQVETVIVNAERREVNLQTAPLAITAVSARALDQSFTNSVTGLNAIVPSLEITKASGFENLVSIRGVGSETPENSLTTVPGVSLFVDGVYIANTISLDQTLFDLDHVEVLRGPQGALYGESSIGGAISIITQQPQLKVFSGSGDFSAGSYNLLRERAEANLPIGDDFALRLSVQKYDHEGFTQDAAIPGFRLDDAHDVSGKVAALWKPSDNFSATLTGMWYHSDQNGDAQQNIDDPSTNPRVLNQDYPGHFELTTQLYHLNMQWNGPGFLIKSVTAYQILDHVQQEDSSRTTFALLSAEFPGLLGYDDVAAWNTSVRNFTEEFDILSEPGSKLDWIAGAFVLSQTSHQFVAEFEGTTQPTPAQLLVLPNIETVQPNNLAYGNDSHATHELYAGFAQATYHFTPSLRLTGGVRINLDNNADPSFNFSEFSTSHSDNKANDSVVTWRIEGDYDLTPDNMIYVSNARGYKPAGANGSYGQAVVPLVFAPETNTSFEIGSKNDFMDHSLRLNVDAFYYIHDNFQYIETDPIPFDGGISNIPRIDNYGVEFEGSYVGADSRFHLNGDLALEQGEVVEVYKTIDSTVANSLEGPDYSGANSENFTTFTFGPCAFFADYGGLLSPGARACYAAVEAAAINIQGKTPPDMPNVSGSINASYRFDFLNGSLTPRVEVVYRGSEWARIFNDPTLDRVPAYTVLNLNLEYAPNNSKLRLSIAATNVGNVAGVNSRYTDPYGTGQTSQQYIPPLQVIGTVAFAF